MKPEVARWAREAQETGGLFAIATSIYSALVFHFYIF